MPDQPDWMMILVYLAAGFVLLGKGADWMVDGSCDVARRMGISTLVIGLTVIAFGTSAPEVVVSGLASWQGQGDISLGNVLGSNVANIGLVLGASAVVLPKVLESSLSRRELLWLFLSLAILWFIASDGAIVRFEAAFLLAVFGVYNVHILITAREDVEVMQIESARKGPPWAWMVAGVFSIAVGAYLVVDGAEAGALRLGIPPSVVGLTVVAVGTSLPELAAGVGGALKGQSDISIGNVVGSNVFNLMAVVGIAGLIQPLDPEHPRIQDPGALGRTFEQALGEDFWVVAAFSLAAGLLPALLPGKGGRAKGALLLVAYAAYSLWLFGSR